MKLCRKRIACITAAASGLMMAASFAAGANLHFSAFAVLASTARGLTSWFDDTVAGSSLESALYRAMQLPGGTILFRRPPAEAVPALTQLGMTSPSDAALWSLRALEDEQALDFSAAERDWKAWTEKSPDRVGAELDLAKFYARRLRPQDELAALRVVGESPPSAQERWTAPDAQRAWNAWERSLSVAQQFDLPRATKEGTYRAWEQRYPNERSVYEQEFAALLDDGDFQAASSAIARYQAAFPHDETTPVQWSAQLAAKSGSSQAGLAIYDKSFQPLWPAQMVTAWYQLLVQSRQLRRVSDALRAKIAADPSDLNDTARLFYIEQQQGKGDSATAVLADYRKRHDASGAAWNNRELYTLAKLSDIADDVPEAARYYYALAASRSTTQGTSLPNSELEGLSGLARLLLTAPQQPLRVGTANLALYRDIATMDRGPGYLNGILSLLFNATSPDSEMAQEEQLAVPYYHRAKAAQIIALIDQRFPASPERTELHAQLIGAYEAYGDNAAVIREGTAFLSQFPNSTQRVDVALETADAYARTGQTAQEFAIYQSLLKELAARADGVPLGASGAQWSKPVDGEPSAREGNRTEVRSQQYERVLNRYLARLVALQQLPQALEVLRGELDRNPQDPGLYERLAQFFQQNSLNGHIEEVYQQAIKQFQSESWYAKLARLYLRQKRNEDYASLSRKVADIFSGTELQRYLEQAPAPNQSLALEVHLYAHQRYPHDTEFVADLIGDYDAEHDSNAVMELLWQHWFESAYLRDRLFEALSSSGKLDAALNTLQQQSPQLNAGQWAALAQSNPAAEQFWVEACLWQSHFEQAVGAANALSAEYPADKEIGGEASSLFRSFAYFHPEDTSKAVAIEKRLLNANPGNLATMARIGDIYADRGRMSDADPYWLRMAEAHPGDADGYLQSATVFWDYFDFSHALEQIKAARHRLNQPTLFGYEAGAIYESAGDLPAAVREYVASAIGGSPSQLSRARLLELAERPPAQPVIESETRGLLAESAPSAAAIFLRTDILITEHHESELAQELNALVARTDSFDALDAVSMSAQKASLPRVRESSLQRQIALTTDPVRKLQLRYQVVDFYVSENQPAAASAEIDAIDQQNPNILGVVRATVDYDWQHDRKPRAVSVLLRAAQAAYPALKQEFQLEAAIKLTSIGQYPQAKSLLDALAAQKPLDARVETAMAENFGRSGDQAGLMAFYQSQLTAVKASNLAASEKLERIGQLRRGIIAAATTLGNSADAVDQYIELIKSYPDDAALAQEAALYATAHDQRNRLFGFFQKAVDASPRDPRWSIVLARLATTAEDYPAAIAAYAKAIALRPERQDLLVAKSDLELRLLRFDDAAADYQKLYALSYHDPQWMVKIAEMRARQDRASDAVAALKEAWINGRPQKAANDFEVAAQLEQWSMLDQARQFAEQGVQLAGDDLLVDPVDQRGAATYARIMARLHQVDAAWDRLAAARQQAANVPETAVAQQTLAGVTSEEWLKQRRRARDDAATTSLAQALRAMGNAAGAYDTPEEKAQFAAWLQARSSGTSTDDLREIYLPAASAAGLAELEADLRWQLTQKEDAHQDLGAWVGLEESRLQLDGVGQKIESLTASSMPVYQFNLWRSAARVYRRQADEAGELRMLEYLANAHALRGVDQARFYRLLLAQRPQELVQRAAPTYGSPDDDSAAQYLVTHGSAEQAFAAIQTRSANLPPVWSKAYTALTGLYLIRHTPQVSQAFVDSLDANATIGDRVANPVNRNQQLAGSVWFYYGSRYGEYLDQQNDSAAEDYLVSELEGAPGNPRAYIDLADYSASENRAPEALADYRHSLALDANQPSVLDRIAVVQVKSGHTADADAAWQSAVALLAKQMNARPVPSGFWADTIMVLHDSSAAEQFSAIREQASALIRAYLVRNGTYLSETLLEAGYHANGDSIPWLLQMVEGLNTERDLLNVIRYNSQWLTKGQKSQLLQRIVDLDRLAAERNPSGATNQLMTDEADLASALLDEGKTDAAQAALAQIPAEQRWTDLWLRPEIRLAQLNHSLPQMVSQWQSASGAAPALQSLRTVAVKLKQPAKSIVLAYVYERAIAERDFSAPNFLGLAAIRLDAGDTAAAMQLLHRMLLVSGDFYPDMDSAASLLQRHHHPAEAMEFLRPLMQSTPWNAAYKVRLAEARLAVTPRSSQAIAMLEAVAANPAAEYRQRIAAAKAIKGIAPAGTFGQADELALLSQRGCPTPQQVSQPMFIDARVAAAACASNSAAREPLLRAALALAPGDRRIRLLYVWAAFGSDHIASGLLAAEPLLESSPFTGTYSNNYQSYGSRYSTARLTSRQAGRLYPLVVHALEAQHDDEMAWKQAQQGAVLARGSPQETALKNGRERLAILVKLQRQNAYRAPTIHDQLEQNHTVQSRLSATEETR